MPTYQYACTDCDHRFDAVQSFSDDALTDCPTCEGRLRKIFSAVGVVFKGSGFYRTDSRVAKKDASGTGEGKGEGKAGGTGEGKADGKASSEPAASASANSKSGGDASAGSSTPAKAAAAKPSAGSRASSTGSAA